MSIIKGDTGVGAADFGEVVEWIDGKRLKRPFRIYQYSYTESEILDAVYEETSNIGKKAGGEQGAAEGTLQERMTLTEDEKSVFARLVGEAEAMAAEVLLPYMPEWLEAYTIVNGVVKFVVKKDVQTKGNSMVMVDMWIKKMMVKYVVWKWMVDAYAARAGACAAEYEEAKGHLKAAIGSRAFASAQARPF